MEKKYKIVYIVSNNVHKLDKKKINVVEFNVFDNHEYSKFNISDFGLCCLLSCNS